LQFRIPASNPRDYLHYVSSLVFQVSRSEPIPGQIEKFPPPVEAPFVKLGLDIIGPHKQTPRGFKYLIVCVDYFTSWVEAKPTVSVTSQDVTNFLIEVFSRHGLPQVINMDNGPQLNSDYTKIFLDLYGIYTHFISVYHPASNGLVENRNREIEKKLRNFVEDNENWDLLLPLVLWALRTSRSSVSGYSSFELLYGREDLLPIEINIRNSIEEPIQRTMDELLIERFLEHQRWIKEAANKRLGTINYWKTRREAKQSMSNKNNYKIGDKVKIRKFQRHKLEPYYSELIQ